MGIYLKLPLRQLIVYMIFITAFTTSYDISFVFSLFVTIVRRDN